MYASMHESRALGAARAIARSAATGVLGDVDTTMLEEQVCAEAGLWETGVARRAVHQARGDTSHAISMLRVWAATQPHVRASTVTPEDVVVVRRLSSAYPQIPGGQWLGFSPDLIPRQLDWTESVQREEPLTGELPTDGQRSDAPSRRQTPRVRDLISGVPLVGHREDGEGPDPARTVLTPPYTRTARLAMLARGETGALVALAALILGRRQEAVLVELTVCVVTVRVSHPRTSVACAVAELPVTEVEVVLDANVNGAPGLALGWGASLGTVERRAISLALLDAAVQADGELAEPLTLDDQTVIAVADGSATTGFVEHLRLPHYASFASYLAVVNQQSDRGEAL